MTLYSYMNVTVNIVAVAIIKPMQVPTMHCLNSVCYSKVTAGNMSIRNAQCCDNYRVTGEDNEL